MKNTAEFLCDDLNTRLSTRTKITGLKTTTPVWWLFAVAAVIGKIGIPPVCELVLYVKRT